MAIRISPTWIKQYCQLNVSIDEMANLLSDSGFETEVVDDISIDSKIVIGEVVAVKKHPNADKLNVCEVNVGNKTLNIVCGCPTVTAAKYVVVAPIGAQLPGMTLKPVTLRGVDSEGMLCSLKELGLSEDAAGIYHVKESVEVGTSLVSLIQHDAQLLEIDVTPNRGDCLSVYGIARDLAASQALNLAPYPKGVDLASIDVSDQLLTVQSESVLTYDAMTLTIDANASTPLYMINRLRQAGMGINHPVVDVLNYIMLELGQPMHGFDQTSLSLPLVMKDGDSQSLVLLDESEYQPNDWDVLVCDQKAPQALAGIMGGYDSRMKPDSTQVQLESATFAPKAIARTLRRCRLGSDASYRYERGVSPDLNQVALAYAASLLQDIANATFGQYQPYKASIAEKTVDFDPVFVNGHLGTNIDTSDMIQILERLGMSVDGTTVTIPAHRYDIDILEDLVEEIARLYGYNNIPLTPMQGALQVKSYTADVMEGVKTRMVNMGYHEIVQFSFVSEPLLGLFSSNKGIEISNPIHAEFGFMRTHIWQSLILAAQHNFQRQMTNIRLFEVGQVFYDAPQGIEEPSQLGALALGKIDHGYGHQTREVDYYDMQALAKQALASYGIHDVAFHACQEQGLHPKQSANVMVDGQVVGTVGMLHPSLCVTLGLPMLGLMVIYLDKLVPQTVQTAHIPSKYPAVVRDLTIPVASGVQAGVLQAQIEAAGITYLKAIKLLDIYQPDDQTCNISWSFTFQSVDETLSDKQIERSMQNIRDTLAATVS